MLDGGNEQALCRFARINDRPAFTALHPATAPVERQVALRFAHAVVALVATLSEDRANVLFKKFCLLRRWSGPQLNRNK